MKLKILIRSLGPGLLWAGAAIGVSHLVQSTRAGAGYGFELVWLILAFNLFKYPFFEFAPRYAASTGENLLHGYKRMGKWVVWLYLGLTFLTMFTLIAAVTAVTAGLFANVFDTGWSPFVWSLVVLLVGSFIVAVGRYSVLDKLIKFIIVLLAISTVIAVAAASSNGFHPDPQLSKHFEWNFADIAVLIAFAGWMPTAIDVSVWHSVWTIAKKEATGEALNLKTSLFDFNVGYIGTAVLSIGFLSLGALVMYGTGEEFSSSGVVFSGQLIQLFVAGLGSWSYILIAIAALTTMASTTLTCLDAYPRVLRPTTEILIPTLKYDDQRKSRWISIFWMVVLLSGSIFILKFWMSNMNLLVDMATTLSFLTAPVLGYMNYRVVMGSNVPEEARPPKWLQMLTWFGLTILTAFSVYFIVWKFFL